MAWLTNYCFQELCLIVHAIQRLHSGIAVATVAEFGDCSRQCGQGLRQLVYSTTLRQLKTFLFLKEGRIRRSRSSEVDEFGANRKRICDFLLPWSYLAPFRRFVDLTADLTPVSVAPDRPCWASTSALHYRLRPPRQRVSLLFTHSSRSVVEAGGLYTKCPTPGAVRSVNRIHTY